MIVIIRSVDAVFRMHMSFFLIKLTFFIDTRLKASFSYLVSLCGQGFYYCKIYEIFLVLIRFSNLSKCYIAQVALIILCKY